MQAHPDPHDDAARPVMNGQSALRVQAAANRIARGFEHDEEAVPLSPHLAATVRRDRGTEQGAQSRERLGVPVTETVQQRRRTLDVAEEHRDGAFREPLHPSIIAVWRTGVWAARPGAPAAEIKMRPKRCSRIVGDLGNLRL